MKREILYLFSKVQMHKEKIFYAKSSGESIEKHTVKALNAFEMLSRYTNFSEEENYIVEKAIGFHDLGKYNPEFQNRMRKLLKIDSQFKWEDNTHIPHEWLSPAFISENEENEIKKKLEKLGLDRKIF